ncbi:hypothetical protein AVEN_24364-1 [Araneus ventricosus]|uniref:Uncharacterized protein n=1 Tax=Araneus ventricosus TaxID=182803 RepID=A0A4Y2HUC8_ARAVE|nr:hypothetical protein AVEN_24364-1 [Araneus ventricosus]
MRPVRFFFCFSPAAPSAASEKFFHRTVMSTAHRTKLNSRVSVRMPKLVGSREESIDLINLATELGLVDNGGSKVVELKQLITSGVYDEELTKNLFKSIIDERMAVAAEKEAERLAVAAEKEAELNLKKIKNRSRMVEIRLMPIFLKK